VILYAKAQGYTSVIDRSAKSKMGVDVVLFAKVEVDITADLLAVLNEDREGFAIDELESDDEE
jgi:Skp family chaperone for outer membrane proteins